MSSSSLPHDAASGAPRAGGPIPRRTTRIADVALALLTLWAGATFLFEAHGAHHDWAGGILYQPNSGYWRVGSRPPTRLQRCLETVDPLLAPSESLLLWSPDDDFYRWRWAAYFLPHRDVVQAGKATPPGSLVVASSRTAPPGARLERGERWCGLYRLP